MWLLVFRKADHALNGVESFGWTCAMPICYEATSFTIHVSICAFLMRRLSSSHIPICFCDKLLRRSVGAYGTFPANNEERIQWVIAPSFKSAKLIIFTLFIACLISADNDFCLGCTRLVSAERSVAKAYEQKKSKEREKLFTEWILSMYNFSCLEYSNLRTLSKKFTLKLIARLSCLLISVDHIVWFSIHPQFIYYRQNVYTSSIIDNNANGIK